jgi:TolB-like protein/Tfp pilus assembly protein PilF
MSPDPNDEYFADGMTEELISAISNISGLSVISHTSVLQYKKPQKKLAEIGQDLGAGTILEGSVRKAGNKIRVAVQLIEVNEDKHLWAQNYDRELQDVFAVQSDIASNVAGVLRAKLLPEEADRIQRKPTDSMGAYLLYLTGKQRRRGMMPDDYKNALADFKMAVAQDPNFARAYTALAETYIMMGDNGLMRDSEAAEEARPEILKALQLDEGLAEAHAVYGYFLRLYDWDWDASETEFNRAIELNASDASAHHHYSRLLEIMGRLEEGLVEARKALELDPLRSSWLVGNMLFELDRYDEAMDFFNRALETSPGNPITMISIAHTLALKGRFEEGIEMLKKVQLPFPARLSLEVASFQARAGRTEEALRTFESATKLGDFGNVPPSDSAYSYASLHDEDKTIQWLEKALAQHDSQLPECIRYPWVQELRTRPRFLEILRKLGLDKS